MRMAIIASVIVNDIDNPIAPAAANAIYISWFAYAIEERESGESAASARSLFSCRSPYSKVLIGVPIIISRNRFRSIRSPASL